MLESESEDGVALYGLQMGVGRGGGGGGGGGGMRRVVMSDMGSRADTVYIASGMLPL